MYLYILEHTWIRNLPRIVLGTRMPITRKTQIQKLIYIVDYNPTSLSTIIQLRQFSNNYDFGYIN